jgi:hypothetical protein
MDSSSIQLPDTEISAVDYQSGCLRIHFSRAIIIKTMTGSAEKTLWWQAGDLLLDDAQVEGELPVGDAVCAGGDIDDNVYTYRDMIPLPLDSRGAIRLELKMRGDAPPLIASGSAIRLEMQGTPRYERHLRDA